MKYNQYCQQRDCQVSADNTFMERCIVLLFGFCGEGEPRENVHSHSESIICLLLIETSDGGSGFLLLSIPSSSMSYLLSRILKNMDRSEYQV